jgi:hypothetical protein
MGKNLSPKPLADYFSLLESKPKHANVLISSASSWSAQETIFSLPRGLSCCSGST